MTALMGVGLATILAGCGNQGPTVADRVDSVARHGQSAAGAPANDECRPVEIGALRVGGLYNYIASTPAQLAERADLVVGARLVKVHEGFRVDGNDIETPYEPYLIIEFEVTDEIAVRKPQAIHGGSVYVRIHQGPLSADSGEPSFGIDKFRKSLPTGAEAVLFLRDISKEPTGGPVKSLPSGAGLVGAGVQGIVIDNCGELVGGHDDLQEGWTDYRTLDDLKDDLRRP